MNKNQMDSCARAHAFCSVILLGSSGSMRHEKCQRGSSSAGVWMCKLERETQSEITEKPMALSSLLSPTFLFTALPPALSPSTSGLSQTLLTLYPQPSPRCPSLQLHLSSHQLSVLSRPSQTIRVKEKGQWQTNDLKRLVSEHSLTHRADKSSITNPFSPFTGRESPCLKPSFKSVNSDLDWNLKSGCEQHLRRLPEMVKITILKTRIQIWLVQ